MLAPASLVLKLPLKHYRILFAVIFNQDKPLMSTKNMIGELVILCYFTSL